MLFYLRYLRVKPALHTYEGNSLRRAVKPAEHTYEGNSLRRAGRVEKITIENLELNSNRVRDEYQQGLAKSLKDGKATDNGGHMAGNQFFGPSEQINYFPQDPISNQSGKVKKCRKFHDNSIFFYYFIACVWPITKLHKIVHFRLI